MAKSFIKIKPITSNSETHNFRKIKPKYLIESEVKNISISSSSIPDVRNKIEEKYKASVGQKMQKKSTPIREAVILLPNDDNENNLKKLRKLTDKLEEKYKIKAFQWHIHNDEGHVSDEGEKKYNYHAHIVFDWTDDLTGKSLKLNKKDMSEIQTITSEIMEMERGVKGSKSLSLNHFQFRGFLNIKDNIEKKYKIKLSEEYQKKLREGILKRSSILDKVISRKHDLTAENTIKMINKMRSEMFQLSEIKEKQIKKAFDTENITELKALFEDEQIAFQILQGNISEKEAEELTKRGEKFGVKF